MNPEWLKWLVDLPLVADVMMKLTVLLALGWTAHLALRRANPRWRVLLWRGVAVGLVAVPLLALSLPKWNLPVAPARSTPPPVVTGHHTAPVTGVTGPLPALAPTPGLPPVSIPDRVPAASPEPALVTSRQNSSLAAWARERATALGVGAWLSVAMALAARFLVGWRRVRRMVKSATGPIPALQDACHETALPLGVARHIELRVSDELTTPFLTGLRRPLLILPARMAQPDYSRALPGILAHELSHLRSNDLFWGYVLQWLFLGLWFHPLVWRIRVVHTSACEEVSDAVTAHFLGDAKGYSQTLARVALEMHCRPPALGGIPMARVSDICRRLNALKRQVFSKPLSRTGVVGCVMAGLLAVGLLSGLRLAHTGNGEAQTNVGENKTKITAPVCEALRGLNTGPLLLGMPQRLVKAIDPSYRTGDLWVGKPWRTDVRLNITLEGETPGEIFVGFFADVNWSNLRAVRAFRGPGDYSLNDIAPGRYYIGAMIGDLPKLRTPGPHWNPAEQEMVEEGGKARITMTTPPEELLRALGVHRDWPQAVVIKRGQRTRIELLVSPDFRSSAVPLDLSHLSSTLGFWPEMDESNMLKGRVTDSTGKPAPFAVIQIREYNPGARSIAAPDVVADENGFFCYDKMEWPYHVGTIFHENLPERIGTRSRYRWIPKVFEGKQEINIQLEPFPTGTATLRGNAVDHKGRPLTRFVLRIQEHGPTASLPGKQPWSTSIAYLDIPYASQDGRFALTDLAAGAYQVDALPAESGAYEFGQQTQAVLTGGKATDVQIVKRANRAFYGRALFEDGAAVYPGSAWPEERPAAGAKRVHGGTRIRATGMFVLYVPEEEMEPNDLKSKMAVIRWQSPDYVLHEVGRFPLSQLGEDRDSPPTLRCKRPDQASDVPPGANQPQPGTSDASAPSEDPAPKPKESAEVGGRIRGAVLNAATRAPVAEAQVAVGHQLGDNDLKRIREQGVEGGLQITVQTDEEGRFVLDGVAFWDYHLLSVKRSGFVPHEEWVALSRDKPEVEVRVNLKLAATITVRVVDAEGNPSLGQIVRIESKDGHALLPARGEWRPELPYRTETARMGTCSFAGLPAGVYWVEAMRTGFSEVTYHGRWVSPEPGSKYITYLPIKPGEAKQIEINSADNRTTLKVTLEKDPHAGPESGNRAALLILSRNRGLLAWAGRNFYHPEDARLARVMQYTLNTVTGDSPNDSRFGAVLMSDSPYTFLNFPPGTYALLALTWGDYKWDNRNYNAVYIRGTEVELSPGKEQIAEIPWVEPTGPSPINPRRFSNVVNLEAREYTAQEICDLLIKETGAQPFEIVAEPSIQRQKVALQAQELHIWDLLETAYVLRRWRLDADFEAKRVVLKPRTSSVR